MRLEDSAKAILSGEYSRRRYHLDRIIVTWDGLALTGTLAIWGFVVKWDALMRLPPDLELFATQIAWASALSSILIAIWRVYAHQLYHGIVKLYPTIYLHERALVPPELCALKPPQDVKALDLSTAQGAIKYIKVRDKDFGSGGHGMFDLIAGIVIVAFGMISIGVGLFKNVITLLSPGRLHLIGYLLGANILGLALVIASYFMWRNCEHSWPIPDDGQSTGDPA